MKAMFMLDENVSWQSCAKGKSKSSFPTPPPKIFLTFQWAFVALWMKPVPLTEALSLTKDIGSAQILSSHVYRHDICSETFSVRKFAPHPSK